LNRVKILPLRPLGPSGPKDGAPLVPPAGGSALGAYGRGPTIFEDLTPVALAVWAMCDGGKHNNGFTFNTQSFTLQQAVLLLNILHIKYGLDCRIYFDRGLPQIHVKPNSMNTFRALVYPYFHSSMLYKLR
jgi:hypothetical protein